jgi:hypothetical protein
MATDIVGRRDKTWYVMLLRLYPRRFREQFGEGMAQTFQDLCRERANTRRGLSGSRCGSFPRRWWGPLGST